MRRIEAKMKQNQVMEEVWNFGKSTQGPTRPYRRQCRRQKVDQKAGIEIDFYTTSLHGHVGGGADPQKATRSYKEENSKATRPRARPCSLPVLTLLCLQLYK